MGINQCLIVSCELKLALVEKKRYQWIIAGYLIGFSKSSLIIGVLGNQLALQIQLQSYMGRLIINDYDSMQF